MVLNRGRVFFCEWPYFDIRISSEEKDKFEIGSVVKVSANFDGTDWKITNIAVDTKVPAFEVKKIQNRKTYYRIPKVHANKYLPNCLFHEIFGMIATPPSFPELIANTHYEFDDVWVALNEVYPGDLIHPQYRFRYVRSGQWDNYEDVERDSLYDFNDDESIISSQSSKRVRFNVPQVSESVEIREDWRTKIDRQVLTISQSEEWRNEPAKKIIAEIDSHCVDCETCRNKRSTEECYFPEIVAQLLRMNTSISRILAERDWFTFVVTRRFTT
ncbi:unnamed protein product [Caenorhabditis angaria]|uniref:Uncharacterized protein n=1 Tax=Caenorhabditis angaria TaxID=860376 RepID=A0A9P1N1S7_9PELO|nr:unnamed protein product [Caenorhabditis angaria]